MLKGRRERAVRERGRPAEAKVVSAARGEREWQVRALVESDDGAPALTATIEFEHCEPDAPRVGDRFAVIVHRGRALPAESPVLLRRPPPPRAVEGEEPTVPPPLTGEFLGDLLRRLTDGSLSLSGPAILVADESANRAPRVELGERTLAELIAAAQDQTDAVAGELLRRVTTGDCTLSAVREAATAAGDGGAAALAAVITSLEGRRRINPRIARMLRQPVT